MRGLPYRRQTLDYFLPLCYTCSENLRGEKAMTATRKLKNSKIKVIYKMKKLLGILLAIVSAFSLVACSTGSTTTAVQPEIPAPWTAGKTSFYERTTYNVTKTNADGTVIASGTAVFTIASIDDTYSEITEDFTITYNDNADEADRGKTDTITSKSKMDSKVYHPVSSEKTVTLADRTDVLNNSYHLTVDYTNKTSELTWLKNGKSASTIDFSDESMSDVYDNETLYYVLRGFTDIKAGGSNTFKLANFFDMHVRDSFSVTTMTFSCSAEGSEVALNLGDNFCGKYGLDDVASVKTVETSLSISATESGAPIDIYYSLTHFKVSENETIKRPLVLMKTYEYDASTASLAYTTEYSISDFTTTKAE